MNFNDVASVSIKGSDYRIHFWYMSKNDAINIMNNPDLIDKMGDFFLLLFCFVLFCFLFFFLFLLLYIKMSNTAYYQKKAKTRY